MSFLLTLQQISWEIDLGAHSLTHVIPAMRAFRHCSTRTFLELLVVGTYSTSADHEAFGSWHGYNNHSLGACGSLDSGPEVESNGSNSEKDWRGQFCLCEAAPQMLYPVDIARMAHWNIQYKLGTLLCLTLSKTPLLECSKPTIVQILSPHPVLQFSEFVHECGSCTFGWGSNGLRLLQEEQPKQ